MMNSSTPCGQPQSFPHASQNPSRPYLPYPYQQQQQHLMPSVPQRALSRSSSLGSSKIQPHQNDILLGRGGNNNMWCGNEAFRELARVRADEYKNASKRIKSIMSIELVAQVKAMSPPGRFLKRDAVSQAWMVVPDDLAREKASQCLRDAVSKIKKRSNSESVSIATPQEDEIDFEPLPIDYGMMFSCKRQRTEVSTANICCMPPLLVIEESPLTQRSRRISVEKEKLPFVETTDNSIEQYQMRAISFDGKKIPYENPFYFDWQ